MIIKDIGAQTEGVCAKKDVSVRGNDTGVLFYLNNSFESPKER
jgi:hypothetical protein